MLQRYSTFLSPVFAFVFVGTFFSLFWTYSATKESSLKVQRKHFQSFTPDKPEYRAFFSNYQSFYGKEREERRERLRQIQKRLESDPESLILKKELATYHAWIKTVPEKRSEINRAKTIEDRLEAVRSIRKEQDRIQGITEKKPRSNSGTMNLFPSIYELAEYLEDLESFDQPRLEKLLGHTPGNFRFQLEKDYRGAVE